MKVKLKILDPTTIEILEGADIVKKIVSYKATAWMKGQFGKRPREYEKTFVFGNKRTGLFIYAGFLDRIKSYCEKRNIECLVSGELERVIPSCEPNVPGIKFRDYQLEGINKIIDNNRGVLQLGTGLGKTLLAVGLVSCFPDKKVLVLCPNLDLTTQFHQEFVKYGFDSVIYSKDSKIIGEKITCTNIQIFSKIDLIKYSDYWDCIVIDEIHLASKSSGTLQKILSSLLIPLRLGLTATIPNTNKERMLTIEGLVGPLLMDKGAKIGSEEGHLAMPKIKLISYPSKKGITAKTYQESYRKFIVENESRNKTICSEIKKAIDSGGSVMAFFVMIEHIKIISKMLVEMGIDHNAVYGEVESEERNNTKDRISSGEANVCLSSVVWREGISINEVSVIVMCGAGRAEGPLLQCIGRGLRKKEGKEECLIIDFLDDSKMLSGQTVSRISTYVRNGWL